MTIKELPEEYETKVGDWRVKDTLAGTFAVHVSIGSEWVELEPVNRDLIGAITEGLELLGRQGRIYYYRPDQGKNLSSVVWPKNESNAGWTQPRFVFGQVVWNRLNIKHEPKIVTGIRFVPAFQDHPSPQSEDEDESTEQTWGYLLNGKEEIEEEYLLARSEVAKFLAPSEPVLAGTADNFDPFLDDLP